MPAKGGVFIPPKLNDMVWGERLDALFIAGIRQLISMPAWNWLATDGKPNVKVQTELNDFNHRERWREGEPEAGLQEVWSS